MSFSTYKLFIISLALFMAAASAAGFMLYRQQAAGLDIRSRLLDLKAWESVVAAEGGLAATAEEGEDLQARLRSLVLLSEADATSFLSLVEGTAAAAGVEVRTVELTEEKISDPDFKELAATFSFRGSHQAVERVIKLLESLPYRSRVERLTLTRGDVSSEALVVVRVSALK